MNSAHDRHLAQWSHRSGEVVCATCDHSFGVDVLSEYGQWWVEPESCPKCGRGFEIDDVAEFEPPEREPDDH